MTTNITGIGTIGFYDASDGGLRLTPAFNATLVEDRTVSVSTGHSQTDCTPRFDLDVADQQSTYTFTISTEVLDEESIQYILFNNREQESAAITLPETVSGEVVSGSLAVPALSVDQLAGVVVLQDVSPGNITLFQQSSGTGVTPTTFEVSAGSVDVDPIYNGFTIVVWYLDDKTNVEIIGGNVPFAPFENVSLFMTYCTARTSNKRIYVPRATSINGVNFDPEADNFSREFRCFLPPGFTVPYVQYTVT